MSQAIKAIISTGDWFTVQGVIIWGVRVTKFIIVTGHWMDFQGLIIWSVTLTTVSVVTGHLLDFQGFIIWDVDKVIAISLVTGHLAGLPKFDHLRCGVVWCKLIVTPHWWLVGFHY